MLIEKALEKKGPSRERGNIMSMKVLIIGERSAQSEKIMGRIRLARVLIAKVTRNLVLEH